MYQLVTLLRFVSFVTIQPLPLRKVSGMSHLASMGAISTMNRMYKLMNSSFRWIRQPQSLVTRLISGSKFKMVTRHLRHAISPNTTYTRTSHALKPTQVYQTPTSLTIPQARKFFPSTQPTLLTSKSCTCVWKTTWMLSNSLKYYSKFVGSRSFPLKLRQSSSSSPIQSTAALKR